MADALFRKDNSLINVTRTTTSTTYTQTTDREPVWYYDADAFDNVSAIYLKGTMRCDSGGTVYAALYTKAPGLASPAAVTGAEISTSSASNVIVTSSDFKANLTDNTYYHVKWKRDTAGTGSIDTVCVIVVQDGPVGKTETVIEIAEDNNIAGTSYAAPTNDYFIYKHDSDRWDGTVTAYLEGDFAPNGATGTVYAALYDITAGAQVSSSEVSFTRDISNIRGTTRSSAITLTDGHLYRADLKGDSTSDDVPAVKIIIKQTGTPTKTACYLPMLNTTSSTTQTTYSSFHNRLLLFDATSYDGDSKAFYFAVTMRLNNSNAITGYHKLYNNTDTADISELTTTSTSLEYVTSTALTMPVDDGNTLNIASKGDVFPGVNIGRSFLIAKMSWGASSTSVKDLIGGFIPFAR